MALELTIPHALQSVLRPDGPLLHSLVQVYKLKSAYSQPDTQACLQFQAQVATHLTATVAPGQCIISKLRSIAEQHKRRPTSRDSANVVSSHYLADRCTSDKRASVRLDVTSSTIDKRLDHSLQMSARPFNEFTRNLDSGRTETSASISKDSWPILTNSELSVRGSPRGLLRAGRIVSWRFPDRVETSLISW